MRAGDLKKRQSILQRAAAAILALAFAAVTLATAAEAQERVQRRSLLEIFFGRPAPEPLEEQKPVRKQLRPRKRTTAPKVDDISSLPEVAPVEKLETAKTILVVGDFLAGGLGDGLEQAFQTSPGVKIDARSNVASGLVRTDYYDWQTKLPALLDDVKPAVVVVAIGANDRQQMSIDGTKQKFRTDAWFAEYQSRVMKLGKIVTDRKIPLLWLGLPAFESPSMTADAVQLNQVYRNQVETVGGEFVDIWDGFVDENGKFIVTGSDINGQQVRLRTSDGINLTTAGRRKLGFYVEKPARRLLGDQASPDLTRLDASSLSTAPAISPAEEAAITSTQPISLSDPDLDGGAELLGAVPKSVAVTLAKSPRDLLVEKGEMANAPSGRVDDYRLPSMAAPTNVSAK